MAISIEYTTRPVGVESSGRSITVINSQRGPQGAAGPAGLSGSGAESLGPRVDDLEDQVDGIVDGAEPLDYYNLAKN